MPPQAIASPIPTTPAAPKPAANDARNAPRSRTTDGRRAGDAPEPRNDRASVPTERSSFEKALDRARGADEAAAAPVEASEPQASAVPPADNAAETPAKTDTERPTGSDGAEATPDAVENAAGDPETVEDGAAVDEVESDESVETDSRAESAVALTGTVETNRNVERPAVEITRDISTARNDESVKPSKSDQPAPLPGGGAKINASTNQATGFERPTDDATAAPISTSTRGTGAVEGQASSSESPEAADPTAPDRAERAARAVRLSERIVAETDEQAPPTNERTASAERVARSANAQAFSDGEPVDVAPSVERRAVPENQPVRVEIPVVSRERATTESPQQAISEGETTTTPGAVQAVNAGARLSAEGDSTHDRPNRSPGKPGGVERLDAVGRTSDSGPTSANTNATSTAQEPRGVSESRASAANIAQAKPEAPAQEQATVMAANRGLDVALKQQGGSVQMRLSPESMGALKVEMTISRGVVAATLQASTPEARDLLTRNIETLRSSLEAKGLSVERLSITLAPASQGGSSGQSFTTNSGPQGQHQPAQGGGAQNSAEHDAGGERSKGFFEHHERQRQGRQSPADHETDERLFKYRMGLHAIA
jgi:Meckel syndrome type 1 protein